MLQSGQPQQHQPFQQMRVDASGQLHVDRGIVVQRETATLECAHIHADGLKQLRHLLRAPDNFDPSASLSLSLESSLELDAISNPGDSRDSKHGEPSSPSPLAFDDSKSISGNSVSGNNNSSAGSANCLTCRLIVLTRG